MTGDRASVAVRQDAEAAREGAEALAVLLVGRKADDGRRAAVEVLVEDQDLALAVGDALDGLSPLAGHLERRLDRFGAAVHRQEAPVAGELADLLAEGPELVVAESARGQGEALRLALEDRDQARVTVPLVDRRIGREAVEVAIALDVPDPGALATLDDDVERMVVVSAVLLLEFDE